MLHRFYRSLNLLLTVALCAVVLAPLANAQERQPAKVEFFAGYAYLDPRGQINTGKLDDAPRGFGLSTSYFYHRNWGFTFDGGAHFGDGIQVGTLQIGPHVRFPTDTVSPFMNFTVGWHRLGVDGLGTHDGIGFTTGGGLDLATWHKRFNFRLIEASYQYGRHSFNPANRVDNSGIRLRSGVVLRFGDLGPPPPPPSAACAATPGEVMAGEPVAVTATPSNFDPKRTLTYSWSASGGTPSGNAATTNVDTNSLQPGSYNVTANISDGRKGTATCAATFTVRAPRPPTVSCSADPSTIRPGESSTITSRGNSPDGRNLTYNYSTNMGSVTGTGTSARYTAGNDPGAATITCNVMDDRNLSASSTTMVNVEAPPPPPPPPAAPEASRLNQIAFKRNSARVDNAAKAILDDVALRMQRDADAKIAIVGSTADGESGRMLAAQRATNAKAYLVKEKGIDPARIELRQGAKEGGIAIIWLVPAGATTPEDGTTAVTEPRKR